jgi:hypothetical protein
VTRHSTELDLLSQNLLEKERVPLSPSSVPCLLPPYLQSFNNTHTVDTSGWGGRLDRLNGRGAPVRSSPSLSFESNQCTIPKEAIPEERRLVQQSYKRVQSYRTVLELPASRGESTRGVFGRRHLSSNTRRPCSTCSTGRVTGATTTSPSGARPTGGALARGAGRRGDEQGDQEVHRCRPV